MNDLSGHPIDVAQRSDVMALLSETIQTHQTNQRTFAAFLLRIDKFRQLNILHGFEAGDRLLVKLQAAMQQMLRSQDSLYRVGPFEFMMIIRELHNDGHAALVALKLINEIQSSASESSGLPRFSFNIGYSLFPSNAQNEIELWRCAEIALMDARDCLAPYRAYSELGSEPDLADWDIGSQLHSAIENDQFELYFQPQIHLATDQVYGAEALLRWKHPQHGFIRPDYFIPLAERDHLIDRITDWTIRSALWHYREWPADPPLKVSVNLSAKVLRQEELFQVILDAARIFDSDLTCLTLEVTETAIMENVSYSVQMLEKVNDHRLEAGGLKLRLKAGHFG